MYLSNGLPRLLCRLTIAILGLATGTGMAASIGGKLELEDYGSFFVNGRSYKTEHPGSSLVTGRAPPGSIVINQINAVGGVSIAHADSDVAPPMQS